jgi:hypothetical protein
MKSDWLDSRIIGGGRKSTAKRAGWRESEIGCICIFPLEFLLMTLGNSITLTGGTITAPVDPEKGKFLVRALAKEPADALLVDQTMQRKVGGVFREGPNEG